MAKLSAAVTDYIKNKSLEPVYRVVEQPLPAFMAELKTWGYRPKRNLVAGRLTRMGGPGDTKPKHESGWALYHEQVGNDGEIFAVGVAGSWKTGEKATWINKSRIAMTAEDTAEMTRALELAREQRDLELSLQQEEAAKLAFKEWQAAEIVSEHAYLARKKILAFDGVKIDRDRLLIPIYDAVRLISLQKIDNNGGKKFFWQGRTKGGWFRIQGDASTSYVVEGYATGASIHMATGAEVYVAFNAGNLYEVASYAKNLGKTVVVAADDDTMTTGNPGRTKALQIADGLGIECVFPEGYNDFNDMHVAEGLDAVGSKLLNRAKIYKRQKNAIANNDEMLHPPGVLGLIVDYYNATAGNPQPGFAVQTALALCSVICGRNFETNYSNRSSLFLMNLGKSGTGKEHARRVIEKVLHVTGSSHLMAGSGYTSGGAVMSACLSKPRHLTIIDEFSKYMLAVQNKNGNGNLQDANTQLMQAIGAPDGVLRPQNYSTMGLAKDRKKDIEDLKVVNPAITLLAMSTPEDLFGTVTLQSIKDGFYNRFIMYVSDMPRSVRENKEPLDVPEAIIEWVRAINGRRDNMPETPDEYPGMVTLVMSSEAMGVVAELEKYKVERANELEKRQLSELAARIPEMCMRLSLIVALACDPMGNVVEKEHMEWAAKWVKKNHAILVDYLKKKIATSQFEGQKLAVLEALQASGEDGVTRGDMIVVKPFSQYRRKELMEILQELTEAGLVEVRKRMTGRAGPPAMVYVAVES